MSYFAAIILGFIEGATEFIPVSSSGHLIIARKFLGVEAGGLAFDAILQLATACSLLLYFWSDIVTILATLWRFLRRQEVEATDRTLLGAVALGTIPAIIFGLLLENEMETIFRSVRLVAVSLILGSLLLWYAQKKARENKVLTVKNGVVIGFFQCLALIPGISRSGATISGGLLSGLNQKDAVRFSFVLSIPILIGAGLKKLFEIRHELVSSLFLPGASFGSALLLGSFVAFLTGLFAIHFLIRYLKTHNLDLFIWYRVATAILLLIVF